MVHLEKITILFLDWKDELFELGITNITPNRKDILQIVRFFSLFLSVTHPEAIKSNFTPLIF